MREIVSVIHYSAATCHYQAPTLVYGEAVYITAASYIGVGKAVDHVERQPVPAVRRKFENVVERHARQFKLGSRFERKHAVESTSVVYAVIVAAYEQDVAPAANERVAVAHP